MKKQFCVMLVSMSFFTVGTASAKEKIWKCFTEVNATPYQNFEIVWKDGGSIFSGNQIKKILVTTKPFFTSEVYVQAKALNCPDVQVGLSKPRYDQPGLARAFTIDCTEQSGPVLHNFHIDRVSEKTEALSGTGYYESYNMKTKKHIEANLKCVE